MTGKEKCKYLKQLRADIAKAYNIDGFEYKECPFVGDCSGTCPACDNETITLYEKLIELDKHLDAQTLMNTEYEMKKDMLQKTDDFMGKILPPEPEIWEEAGVMVMDDDTHLGKGNKPISPNHEPLSGKITQLKNKPPINQRDGRLKGAIRPPQDQTHFDDTKNKPRGLRGLFKKKK